MDNAQVRQMIMSELRSVLNQELIGLFDQDSMLESVTQSVTQSVTENQPSIEGFYGRDDYTLNALADTTSCFGTYLKKECEDSGCALLALCKESKKQKTDERAETRSLRSEIESRHPAIDFKEMKKSPYLKGVDLSLQQECVLQEDIVCALSMIPLKKGEYHTLVNHLGIIHYDFFQYLTAL